jgi:chromosomal replication initiation ATPase DnaA
VADLRSRLKAGDGGRRSASRTTSCSRRCIVKLFADRQLFVDERLVAYIVARMERSLEAAQTLVERLDRLALARGSRITRTLAQEVLGDMTGGEDFAG